MTTTNAPILNTYQNGGYEVTIFEDGTKIRKQISSHPPITPESIDLKITDKCDLSSICKWCHEDSHEFGKHGNLSRVLKALHDLPPGAELAIGGGNPLSHPELKYFLTSMKNKGVICNLTVNQRHVNAYKSDLIRYIDNKLIHGLGISRSGTKSIAWLYDHTDNLVFHVIAGINNINDILMLPKTLILGYKRVRKGEDYWDETTEKNIADWKNNIHTLLGNKTLSFDNLALNQLNIKKHLSKEKWDEIYMGKDATFTYYIDAVNQRFGHSSITQAPFGLLDSSAEMLKYIRGIPPIRPD